MAKSNPIIEHILICYELARPFNSCSANGLVLDSLHQTYKWSNKFIIKLRAKLKYFLWMRYYKASFAGELKNKIEKPKKLSTSNVHIC